MKVGDTVICIESIHGDDNISVVTRVRDADTFTAKSRKFNYSLIHRRAKYVVVSPDTTEDNAKDKYPEYFV